jgi:hypothetical protein
MIVFDIIGETTLYRGDSTKIDQFDQSKSAQMFLLYTHGIYLTDSPDVAADYTLKDSEHTVYRDDQARDAKTLLQGYIKKIANETLGLDGAIQKLRSKWQEKAWQAQRVTPRGELFDSKPFEQQMRMEVIALTKKFFLKAKKLVMAQRSDLRVMKLTTGEWAIVKTDREGYVTQFEVPEAYLAKTLHVDQPLSVSVLDLIKRLWAATSGGDPERVYDMRNAAGELQTFDKWVKAFQHDGITFAWDEEGVRNTGGKGELPDLETIWHGTHMGGSWFHDRANVKAFVAGLQDLGYVGLEYSGGVRLGAHTRGGGGIQHRAFVFWDDDAINRFRVSATKVIDPEIDVKQLRYVRSR